MTLLRSAAVSPPEGEGAVETREIVEITKDDYAATLEAAGSTLLVVDFFTSWSVLLTRCLRPFLDPCCSCSRVRAP